MNMLKTFSLLLTVVIPWRIRRRVLEKFLGYKIHPTARIGLAWVFPGELEMGENSRIDHFTVAIHLEKLSLGKNSRIGRSNWITGFPRSSATGHFGHQPDRTPQLSVGDHSAITRGHHLDCTHSLNIGSFTTIAGYSSQFLTHSIDLINNRQDSAPIKIGDYCFVGTNVVVLGGSCLPSHSVLGAKSLLQKSFETEWCLYAGIPAAMKSEIPSDAAYFSRTSGFVV